MRIFGSLTDCERTCTPTEKPSEGGPRTCGREDPVVDKCCGGTLDECCKDEEAEPTK